MNKPSFSGHESFICKQFWLKKGFDFIKEQKKFSDESAVIDLGVGKNMVNSIRFWLKAFGLMDENDKLNTLAEYILGEKGKDPYLEDFGTIWLFHYHLVKTNRASIYNLVFNEFRKERIDFTKEQLHAFLKRKCSESGTNTYNLNSINTDINVFLRSYIKPIKDKKLEIEDDFSGVLIDVELVKHYKLRSSEGKITDWFKIESEERIDLPYQIVLYTILDNHANSNSVSFRELHSGSNSPGLVFALNAEGLYGKIKQITENYPKTIYAETAGNQVLQFKSKLDKYEILNDYFGK